MIEADCHFL